MGREWWAFSGLNSAQLRPLLRPLQRNSPERLSARIKALADGLFR